MMQDLDFNEIVDLIARKTLVTKRRPISLSAWGSTIPSRGTRRAIRRAHRQSQHVSGRELLEGLARFALDQYGPLAKTVLESWGVHRCTDFGEIVFNLIEYRVFSKTESDRREDFADIFDFDDAFVKPFRPADKTGPDPSTKAVESA